MAADRPSAIRLFPGDHPSAPHLLKGRLEAMRKEFAEGLISGFAADYADYRYRAGQVNALDRAIGLCEQVETDLRREN